MTQGQIFPGAAVFPASFTPEKREELFHEIVRLYDLTDIMLSSMQKETVPNRSAQFEVATPFITQVTNSTNILSAFYNEVVNKNLPINAELQDTMETAFRNIFIALKELTDSAEDKLLSKGNE